MGVNDDKCYSCGRSNPGLWGYAGAIRRLGSDLGFVQVVIIGSSVLFVLMLLMSNGQIGMQGLFNLLSPSDRAMFQFGASGGVPMFLANRWWTVLSAGWLHGSLLHILFNMMWVRQLGPATAEVFGAGRMIIIYTLAGVAGFLLSSFMGYYVPGVPLLGGGAGMTLGASASVFGLLGALVAYGRLRGSSAETSQALMYAVVLFVFGMIM